MPYLKKEAPPEVLETMRQLEAQADECWRPLRILQDPPNVAIWALLTGGIERVEREQAARGSNTPHFDAMLANLSRLLAIGVKWAIGNGRPAISPQEKSWRHELAAAVGPGAIGRDSVQQIRGVFSGISQGTLRRRRDHTDIASLHCARV